MNTTYEGNFMNTKTTLSERISDRIDNPGQSLPGLESLGNLVKEAELMPSMSEQGKTTIVGSTQDSIYNIHKITIENTADMTAKSVDALSSIAKTHESKASESIQAIERITLAGQQSLLKESKGSKNGVLGAALFALGAFGGALTVYNKLKK